MFQGPPREKEWLSWLFVLIWSSLVFAVVPFARAIRAYIVTFLPNYVFTIISVGGTALAAGIAIYYLWRSNLSKQWRSMTWLLGTVAIFIFFSLHEMAVPEEALHFLEYGFLGLLMFRALSHRCRDRLVYVSAILLVLIVGSVDEIIQWLTPGRYWDYRDVLHNGLAAVLAQVALAKGLRPPFINEPIRPRSVRLMFRLAMALLLISAFCIANTPAVVSWYANRIPWLAYLKQNDSVMCEYGYLHADPKIGIFNSRFSVEELRHIDELRGKEVGDILRAIKEEGSFLEMLHVYTAGADPFLHEVMVHLNRRNHYYTVVWKYKDDPKLYSFHNTVVYRENQILESYFPRSLEASHEQYGTDMVELLKQNLNTNRIYKSPVSNHLITRYSERQLLLIIGILILIVAVVDVRWGRERHHVENAAEGK